MEAPGEGINEKGIVVSVSSSANADLVGRTVVAVSEDFYRPTDVVNLWGDPTKAKAKLGWNTQTTTFEQLVELMVKHDMVICPKTSVTIFLMTSTSTTTRSGAARLNRCSLN